MHTHTHTHTHAHKQTHTHLHMRMHTHTHTHTQFELHFMWTVNLYFIYLFLGICFSAGYPVYALGVWVRYSSFCSVLETKCFNRTL